MTQRLDPVDVYDPPSLRGPDYIVQFRIKNGPLMRAMRSRGYKTIAAFARACGVAPPALSRYFSLQQPAMRKSGNWTPTVLLMAKTLRLPPECLFPEQHLDKALARSSGEAEVTADEIRAMIAPEAALDPEQQMIADERDEILRAKLYQLPARAHRVLAERFGFGTEPKTLEETGAVFGIARERVRQIEAKAFRTLKHPARGLSKLYDGRDRAERLPARHYVPQWKRDELKARWKKEREDEQSRQEAARLAEWLTREAATIEQRQPDAEAADLAEWPEPQPGFMMIRAQRHYFVRADDVHMMSDALLATLDCREVRGGIMYFLKVAP